jgi:hypothetical protein
MKERSDTTLDEVVEAVCRLPLDFHAIGYVSVLDLVRRSGYGTKGSDVTVERLAKCLLDHPDWVERWFRWSMDNRGSPAWYIRETESGDFELGFSQGSDSPPPLIIADKVQAAAEFVHRYLARMADPT